MIKGNPQFSGDILVNQTRSDFQRRQIGWVRQDNNAPQRVSVALPQTYPVKKVARSHLVKTNSDRVKKHSTKRQTVIAAGWIKKPISEEINHIAADMSLTRSGTIATLLEEAVHQKLHTQHAVLLGPVIQNALAKEREKDRKRFGELLVQNTVLTRRIVYLLTNMLRRMITSRSQAPAADQLHKVLDWSKQKARETTFRRSHETEALIDAIGAWLDWEDEQEGVGEKGRGQA
jgi:hypothetical protein